MRRQVMRRWGRAMRNPWNAVVFPNDNYVHSDDRLAWSEPVRYPPQPYLSSFITGKVMWLLGGFGTGDNMAIDHHIYRERVLAWAKENLAGDLPNTPSLWLGTRECNPGFLQTRDVRWWRGATNALFQAMMPSVGENKARIIVAERLFVLEAFPYPARDRPNRQLPTHKYSAYLLQEWLRSGRPVVVGRAKRFWCELVPQLADALGSGQAVLTRNVQKASISPGNLQGGLLAFQRIVSSLLAERALFEERTSSVDEDLKHSHLTYRKICLDTVMGAARGMDHSEGAPEHKLSKRASFEERPSYVEEVKRRQLTSQELT